MNVAWTCSTRRARARRGRRRRRGATRWRRASAATSSRRDEARRVAGHLAEHREVGAHDRPCLAPSPRAPAGRSPRAGSGTRTGRRRGRAHGARRRPRDRRSRCATSTRSPRRPERASSASSQPRVPASTSRCGRPASTAARERVDHDRHVLARLERADPEHVRARRRGRDACTTRSTSWPSLATSWSTPWWNDADAVASDRRVRGDLVRRRAR